MRVSRELMAAEREWHYHCDIDLRPIGANFGLEASCFGECDAWSLGACTNVFCKVWAVSVELKSFIVRDAR